MQPRTAGKVNRSHGVLNRYVIYGYSLTLNRWATAHEGTLLEFLSQHLTQSESKLTQVLSKIDARESLHLMEKAGKFFGNPLRGQQVESNFEGAFKPHCKRDFTCPREGIASLRYVPIGYFMCKKCI